jgi:hypothetical protein
MMGPAPVDGPNGPVDDVRDEGVVAAGGAVADVGTGSPRSIIRVNLAMARSGRSRGARTR